MSVKINTDFISNQNSYDNQVVKYICVHNTDNYNHGANAKCHAKAQHDGNFSGYSAHVYVDDTGAYQATPYNRGAWHIGVNYGGRLFGIANNRNTIGIEVCVQAGYNYEKAFLNAVDVCKQLMKKYDVDADHVIQHYDACAKNCPSAIRAHKDWARFKKAIQGAESAATTPAAPRKLYRVRKTWADAASQIGAYEYLENAKLACPAGYRVFDESGKAIYKNDIQTEGMQASELKNLTPAELIKKIGPLFTKDQLQTGILASVSMAQFILESGWGKSKLTQNANNAFGMKKNLSGNTWPGSKWDGVKTIPMKTGEQTKDGKSYSIVADFRVYDCLQCSIGDHSAYLAGAKNGNKLRYEGLKGCKDYKKAATIIKKGGYATDTQYVQQLCKLIEQYGLTAYDVKTGNAKPETSTDTSTELKPTKRKTFQVKITATDLRIRRGPGTNYPFTGKYTGKGKFTITEEQNGWGRLKSGAGWICLELDCVTRV